ncbi:MAG: hypothetical protein NT078_02120, partial [Candidatus Azambacteria bacterium]|nr:hypothetical protein [Candidatus Azambacteria bacterium]
ERADQKRSTPDRGRQKEVSGKRILDYGCRVMHGWARLVIGISQFIIHNSSFMIEEVPGWQHRENGPKRKKRTGLANRIKS